jgi:hypothetical protein
MPSRRRPRTTLLRAARISLALSFVYAPLATADDFIWIEGESARTQGMKRHSWYDDVTKIALSGGDWLSHFAPGDAPEAEYRVSASESGPFEFWVRCNTVGDARISYRLGDGKWTRIDTSRPVGQVNIASDGKPDLRFVAWVGVGTVDLPLGESTLRFRFESANHRHGGIDCFIFSKRPFRPRGILRPGERSGRANPGYFAWEPDSDPFSEDALVDLRFLNEDVAGAGGRVRAAGSAFVLASGAKTVFWAANAGPGVWSLDHASHIYLARRLAKSGVNMVRLHGALYRSRDPRIDLRRLDDLHHLVHALKEEGIYSSLSFFFPLWFELDPGQRSFMVLFFDEEMQRIWFDWAKTLLSMPNPYTGLPLGRDPALAIVEIVNEDSHFFWTFGKKNTTEARWRRLQSLFGAWLVERHGSLVRAFAAWGDARSPDDDADEGRIELFGAWEMTADGIRAHPARKARIRDQVRFLAENMRGFYATAIRHLAAECGYDGLVTCGNWHVSDPGTLDTLERFAYTAGTVIDRHGYFDRGHEGEASSWSVRPGQTFESESALFLRHPNPIPGVDIDGYPNTISELGWPMPNAYRAEYPFLAAAYGRLQGIDGIFSFALGGADWDVEIGKFPLGTPVMLGSFPAAALVYRLGYVAGAPTIVLDHAKPQRLFDLDETPVTASAAFDRLRAPAVPEGETPTEPKADFDPLSFYVGRVARSFAENATERPTVDVRDFIDRERKVVRSVTGELAWDYGRGLVTLATTKAIGAAGFLGRVGQIDLDGASIAMRNDYGAVMLVSLDGRPLADSARILIQCSTKDQFYGFRATGPESLSGRIESVGSAPIGVERFDVEISLELEGEQPIHVIACDEHGYATPKAVTTSREPSAFRIVLDPTSPYHVVERR